MWSLKDEEFGFIRMGEDFGDLETRGFPKKYEIVVRRYISVLDKDGQVSIQSTIKELVKNKYLCIIPPSHKKGDMTYNYTLMCRGIPIQL